MNPIQAVLYRMFGRPRGTVGRIGGRLMTGAAKREMAKWVVSELDIEPTDRVLEVGYGPGIGIEVAIDATPEGSVAGVDYSREMVTMARKRNAAAIDAGDADLRYGAAADLPFGDATFDAVFSINSMQVWPDALAGLEELRRVLKPHGRVALAFTPIAGQSRDEARSLLGDAGFTEIRIREGDIGMCVLATP